jgi:replicative DNA helicase
LSVVLGDNVDELFVTHKDVWEGLKSYYGKYKAVPEVSVLTDRFNDFEGVATTSPTPFYLDQLKNEYIKTRLDAKMVSIAHRLEADSGPRLLAELQNEVTKLTKFTNNVRDLDLTDFEQAEEHIKKTKERALLGGGTVGIPTGIASIDSSYHTGMAPGHLIVAIGWPAKGKTWFTSYLAAQAWNAGYKPMVVSLEMNPEQMRDRIYTMMGEGIFRNSDFAKGDISLDDFRAWGKRKFTKDKQGFVIVSNDGIAEVTPNTLQAKIDQHRPDLVICDYHQLFMDNQKTEGLTPRNMNLSRQLKLLAVSNNIPVIDITAATAEEKKDRDTPPLLSDVAWSKAIEYDADMAFAVHKYDDSGLIEVISRKNRHGSDFAFYLNWDIDRGIITEEHGLGDE